MIDAEAYCREEDVDSLKDYKPTEGKSLETEVITSLKKRIDTQEWIEEQPYPIKEIVKRKKKSLAKKLSELKDVIDIQCSDSNWNYDEYNFGMANGLLLAEGIIKDKDSIFLNKPKNFIQRRKKTWGEIFYWSSAILMMLAALGHLGAVIIK